jgi:hypothetical protein
MVTALGTPVRLLPPPPATTSERCRAHSTPNTGYGSWCESVRASFWPLLLPLLLLLLVLVIAARCCLIASGLWLLGC